MASLSSRLLASVSGIKHAFEDSSDQTPKEVLRCHQVHGDRVVEATEKSDAVTLASTQADGLFTRNAALVAVQTADCLPVLFAGLDTQTEKRAIAVAAVHAGWRGLQKGILLRAVDRFQEAGIPADRIVVSIGPGLRACCFEVQDDVIQAFQDTWSKLWENTRPRQPLWSQKSARSFLFDAPAVARLQLESAGILHDKIDIIETCTYCGSGNWASFRRSTHAKARGEAPDFARRQWSWISLAQRTG